MWTQKGTVINNVTQYMTGLPGQGKGDPLTTSTAGNLPITYQPSFLSAQTMGEDAAKSAL